MDITDIRTRRNELEQAILALVQTFEADTGVMVRRVRLIQATGKDIYPRFRTVNAEVRIVV